MNAAFQPFLTVALPIMVTLIASTRVNNSRLTDMKVDFNRRFDEVFARLDRIERKLDNHDERIVRGDVGNESVTAEESGIGGN